MKPLAVHPRFVEASAEIDTLNSALAKVDGRITEISALLNTGEPQGDSSHVAAALSFAETGIVKGPDNAPSALHEEHIVLRQQAEALRNTIAQRHQARQTLAAELSAVAVAEAAPAHDALLKRYATKLLELDALRREEADMVRALEGAGFSAGFREYVQWPLLGSAEDSGSVISMRLRQLPRP